MSHRIVALLLSTILLVTAIGLAVPVTRATAGTAPLGETGDPPPADILATPTNPAANPVQRSQFDEDGQGTAAPLPGTMMFQVKPSGSQSILTGIQNVSGGSGFTCALTNAGNVLCWGDNYYGQLGDGTASGRAYPAPVGGLGANIVGLATGGRSACIITTTGALKCWGDNYYGQLGDGTTTVRRSPVVVSGMSVGVRDVSVGWSHTCAVTAAGATWCWGSNSSGQLGDGTQTNRTMPVLVLGLASDIVAVQAGGAHTCALTTAGEVKCWGDNYSGQLGDGTKIKRLTPVSVSGLNQRVTALATTTDHNCVRLADGSAKCWGDNYVGQIGDGTKVDRAVPVTVVGLGNDVAKIETGIQTTCALNSTGGLKCWGTNYWGQVGDGTWDTHTTPVQVVGLASGVVKPAQGWNHNCALMQSSGVKCWGADDDGQLGTGTATYISQTPADVIAGSSQFFDAAELASQAEYPSVAPGGTVSFWINVRNTGTTTWRASDGYGSRGDDQWLGRSGTVWRDVPPGDILSFSETFSAPTTPGEYVYGFMLRHGTQEFGPYFFVRVTVQFPAISGRVTAHDGQPVGGAIICYRRSGNSDTTCPITTGGDGRYQLRVESGNYGVWATLAGYQPFQPHDGRSVTVSSGDVTGVDFILGRTQPVDFAITEVKIIQAVEDAPLVVGKDTTVRVRVRLKSGAEATNVKVKLISQGQTYDSFYPRFADTIGSTGELTRHETAFDYPPYPIEADVYFFGVRPPSSPAAFAVTARIEVAGETNPGDNESTAQANAITVPWGSDDKLSLVVMPIFGNHSSALGKWATFIEKTFPLAASEVEVTYEREALKLSGAQANLCNLISPWCYPLYLEQGLRSAAMAGKDRLVLVTPPYRLENEKDSLGLAVRDPQTNQIMPGVFLDGAYTEYPNLVGARTRSHVRPQCHVRGIQRGLYGNAERSPRTTSDRRP